MFKGREELAFYSLVGIGLAVVLWAAGLFGLRAFPLSALLLISAYALDMLLAYMGLAMTGKKDETVYVLHGCGVLAFLMAWASNPGKSVPGSLALPAALMFLAPSGLYLFRKLSKSDLHVQPK